MFTEPAQNPVQRVPFDRLGTVMTVVAGLLRFLERSAGPVLDLVMRLWLAQAFFVSGLLKIANWDNALLLAREEYPVAWLDPVTAAFVGVAIELIAPVLLAAGLATRLAAIPLAALVVVIQLEYQALDQHLLWIAVCAWYLVRGAGAISLDSMLARGLAGSALPFAAAWRHVTSALERVGLPLYQLGLRLWLAATLVAATSGTALGIGFPASTVAPLADGAGLVIAVLLALGLATRLAALAMIGLTLLVAMPDAGPAHWLGLTLALLVLHGPGALALDHLLWRRWRRIYPVLDGRPAFALEGLPRVVIVGGGFGGLTCAADLARARCQLTLIDRHNYHLFQPLLYQVATAALSPGDIATPIRSLFRERFNACVLLGEVSGVDTARREVIVGERRIPYDYLVLATGASHSYFGRDDWAVFAPGLKRIEDATEVRRRLLLAFERAEAEDDPAERQALLTFLIVGGGPTGVELAGAIAELARLGMEKEYRRFDPANARVILVQSGARLLPTFPERLSAITQRSLDRLGVEVLTGSRVEDIDAAGVSVNGRRIASHTVFWAAGVVASPAARWLGVAADNAGRIKVESDLSVPGLPNVFGIGDTVLARAWNGQPVPGLAPAAKQGGNYVARVIRARLSGAASPSAFRYHHLGSLATIGRKAAVADFGRLRLSGGIAWWLWGLLHVYFLVGVRNRVSVMLDWFWSYLTYSSGTRLITHEPPPSTEVSPVRVTRPREVSHV